MSAETVDRYVDVVWSIEEDVSIVSSNDMFVDVDDDCFCFCLFKVGVVAIGCMTVNDCTGVDDDAI